MNERLLDSVRLILAAPWRQRRNRKGMWSVGVIVGLCFLVPAALFGWSLLEMIGTSSGAPGIAEQLRHTALVASAVAVGVLALAWWASLVANVLEQNQPALARLVPTHPTCLRVALVTACAAITLAMSLFVFTVAPDDRTDPLAVSVICAGALALLAASLRWPLMWTLGCVAPFVMGTAYRSPMVAPALAAIRMQWHDAPLLLAATALAASGVLLVALIQDGGSRHAANYETRRVRTALFSARARGERPVHTGSRRCFRAVLERPYDWWLNRLLARSDSSARARLLAGLGPSVHWIGIVTAVALMSVAIPVAVSALQLLGFAVPSIHRHLPMVAGSGALGAMFGLVAPATQTRARLHQTRREQAVLALLPGVPQGAALARWLSLRMTAQCVLAWIGAVAISASLAMLALHLPGDPLDRELIDFYVVMPRDLALGSLSVVAFQWPRWARASPPTSVNALWPTLGSVAVAALVFCGDRMNGVTLTQSGAVVALAIAAWCAWRWHRMGREPSAFPVGRLAR